MRLYQVYGLNRLAFRMGNFFVIAVDGGAGTGKSTLSNLLSERKNFLYVETGAHYRALTCLFLENSIAPNEVVAFLKKTPPSIKSKIHNRKSHILVNNKEFELEDLRAADVNANVSHFAAISEVRKCLFQYQRTQVEYARQEKYGGIVLEGRDIGTKIFPESDLKIFLYSDAKIRIARRIQDGEQDLIKQRDKMDANRQEAPLACAADALKLDTGKMCPEEVYEKVISALVCAK